MVWEVAAASLWCGVMMYLPQGLMSNSTRWLVQLLRCSDSSGWPPPMRTSHTDKALSLRPAATTSAQRVDHFTCVTPMPWLPPLPPLPPPLRLW
jgi:hypothetical protein